MRIQYGQSRSLAYLRVLLLVCVTIFAACDEDDDGIGIPAFTANTHD